MAFKTIQVNLEFNANTQKAKAQMQQLQQQLNSLVASQPTSQLSLTPQLQQAQQAALQLKIALNNATNVDTGKLNLTKFQAQLKQSGISLQQIAGHMRTLGPEGVKAFSQLSFTIAQADTRMFQLGTKTKSFLTSIAHSAQYQMASSLIYGTINAFSQTLDYAKELDTSLNNIRIVTGKNANEMARFAKEANKAAKELSTTTTAYTDASLIYYQQGLNNKAVKDRTETTVRLANVTGESAQEVSEWMTAIWNNFYDGADSLESYADKLAKLGAATASSADEIAAGLEKFAAVADTVGLSYDYAASALATITAETRQSADVVGTALKTLFARIEGLKFGETLEDGTTLNQYSEALSKVGVHIKDTNGELKNMDTILTETGMRWNTLAKDEQIALAQSVAGIRQYTQFMALMDNWDVMEENLELTKEANGELGKQNEIYETSAQAAQKRMQTAAEEFKTLIVGGEDLTKVYNFAGGALEVVSDLFDAFGGLKTILYGVAAALMNLYQPQIANFFSQMAVNAIGFGTALSNGFHGKGFQTNQSYKQDAVRMGADLANNALPEGSKQSHYLKENAAIEEKMLTLGNSINATTKQRIEHEFELIKAKEKLIIATEEELALINKANNEEQEKLVNNKLSTDQASHFASQATAKGAMEGYGALASENIKDTMSIGPLNGDSRAQIVDKTKASLKKATTAATTGLPGEAGLGLNLDDIMVETGIDDEMISITRATEQANQALDNYATNGMEDLNALLILIEKINKAMSEAGASTLDEEKSKLIDSETYGEMGKKYEKPFANPTDSKELQKDLNKIDESTLKTKEVTYRGKKVNLNSMKQEAKAIEKLKQSQAGLNENSEEYSKIQQEVNSRTKTLNGQFNKFIKAQDKGSKIVNRTAEATEDLEKSLDATRDSAESSGKAVVGLDTSAEGLQEDVDNLNNALDNGGQGFTHWSDTLVSSLGTISSVAMGISMLTNSAEQMGEMFASGEHSISGWISSIASMSMSLAMVVPGLLKMGKSMRTIIANRKLMNKLQNMGIEQDQIEMLLNKKKTAEEIAGDDKEMASNIKAAMTENAKNLGKGPSGWAIFAAAAVGIAAIAAMAGVGAGNVSVQQQRESNDADIEEAEGALEVAKGWTEEAQSMDDLISKHNELDNATNKTIETQQKLKEAQQAVIDQVPQLVEKYKELDKELDGIDLSGDIAILEGAAKNEDVKQIEEITNRIDEKAALEVSQRAKGGQTGALSNLGLTIDETTGDAVSNGKTTVHVGDFGKDKGEDLLASILGVKSDGFWGGGVDIELDMTDPKKFAETYEKLREFKKQMEEEGLIDDDTYKEVNELLLATSEEYEKLKILIEDGRAYEIQTKANEIGFDPTNVNTYAEYVSEKERLVKATVDAGIANREEAEAWIAANKALSEYSTLEKSALAYRDKYGFDLYNDMLSYAKDLENEEDLKAFLKIDIDKYQVEETWDGLVKYIKKQEEAEKLQADLTAMTSANKNLKSNGTVKDYQKLQESISWGEKGFIEYSKFLDKSYDQQKAYLEGMTISIAEQTQAKAIAAEQELKNTKEATQRKNENLQTDINDLEIQITKLELSKNLSNEEKKQLEDAKKQLKLKKEELAHTEVDLQNLDKEIEKNKINQKLAELQVKQAKEARAQRIRDFENSKQALEDEYDAYRHINEINEDLARTMGQIADAKEHAYGGDYLALLDQEIRGLEVENDLLDKTIELANKRAAAHKKELTSDYGAEFDSFGNISNYNEIQGQYLQELAELEGSKGKDSEAYKNKKEEYDDFIKLAEDYNEDLQKSEEATEKSASNMREMLDKKLEGIEYEINIKIEVDQHYLNILERQLKRLDDDAYDGAERMVNYGQQASKIYDKQQNNASGIKRVLSESGVSEADIEQYMQGNGDVVAKYNLSANAIEELEKYTDGFIESQEQFEELAETVKGEVMTTFNAWHDNIGEVGDSIAAQGELIQNYQNIVDIVGKDKLGINDATLKALEQANNAAAQASLNNARAQKEATESALENAKAKKSMYEVGSEEYEYWAKTEKELNKQLEEDTANFMSSWENALTTAYETFENETERAIDNLSDYMAGINFDSMDDLSKNFEWQQEVSDRYLENYEKAYELSKLNRKIQKDIEATDSVKAQKMLRDMQEEIAEMQAAGVKMSQHDLEILQKKYDLRLAEIAMEEAQNAKSKVTLTRDSEGNFGYVYTADETSISNAEQNYEDKLYAMQKSNADYIENLSKQIIDNRKAMADEIAAIDVTAYASKEEYLKAVQDITIRYQEKENYLLGEIQKTITSNQDIYNNDVLAYGSFVGQQENASQTWVTSFGNTTLSMVTGFTTIEDAQKNLNDAIGNPDTGTGLLGSLDDAYNNLDSNVNTAMFNAGTSITGFGTTVNTVLYGEDGNSGAIGEIKDLTKKTEDYKTTAVEKFGNVVTGVTDWYKTYGPTLQTGKTDTDNLEQSIAKLKSQNITISTTVGGQDQVEALTGAIEKVKDAIEKLKDTEFKITANVSVNTEGSVSNDDDSSNHEQKNQVTWETVSDSSDINEKSKANNVSKGTSFEVVQKKAGESFAIYQQQSNQGEGTKSAQATWINNNELDNVKWERVNNYVRYDENGKAYITAKVTGYSSNVSESTKTNFAKNSQYYIPIEYVNAWGDSRWATEDQINSLYGKGNNVLLKDNSGLYGYSDTSAKNKYVVYNQGLQGSWELDSGTGVKILDVQYANGNYWYQLQAKKNDRGLVETKKLWFIADQLQKLDTGGYTGEWGPEGRLAMLHQKEIVLNAHDTENFLAAIGIVRDISDQIEKNAIIMQYQNQLANYRASVGNGGETLQQEVHITAEFPNATNHNEIEEAFKNLTNLASQYANRKN